MIQKDVFIGLKEYMRYLDAIVLAKNIIVINEMDELDDNLRKVAINNAISIQRILKDVEDVAEYNVINNDIIVAYVHSIFLAEHVIRKYLSI